MKIFYVVLGAILFGNALGVDDVNKHPVDMSQVIENLEKYVEDESLVHTSSVPAQTQDTRVNADVTSTEIADPINLFENLRKPDGRVLWTTIAWESDDMTHEGRQKRQTHDITSIALDSKVGLAYRVQVRKTMVFNRLFDPSSEAIPEFMRPQAWLSEDSIEVCTGITPVEKLTPDESNEIYSHLLTIVDTYDLSTLVQWWAILDGLK